MFKKFVAWVWRKIAFILALVVVPPMLWYFTALRAQIMDASTKAADWALQSQGMVVKTAATPFVSWAVFGVIAIVLIIVVSLIFRIVPMVLVLGEDMLRFLANILALGVNVAFAIYAYAILWGSLHVFGGVTVVEAFDPNQLSFGLGSWLGKIAMAYLFFQALPLVFKPRISVGWSATDLFFSAIPLAVILSALLAYLVGQYQWSTYRLEALWIWVPMEAIDIIMSVAGLRYLTRGFISSEEVVRTSGGGGHHGG